MQRIAPLPLKDRLSINNRLADLCRHRLPSIPLADIMNILGPQGYTIEQCILTGRNGQANIDVFNSNGQEVNTWLVLSWLKGDHDGQWEVNAYMS